MALLGGRAPTFKDVQEGRLQYTQRVVKESLRKYAPINLFPRLVGPLTSSHIHGGDLLPFRDLSLFLSQLVLEA